MTKDLQQATARLAEKAGERVQTSPNDEAMHWKEYADMAHHSSGYWDVLPGATGTYTAAEVNTVLEWLAKAGYGIVIKAKEPDAQQAVAISINWRSAVKGFGDTLPEALANAVRKLEL